MLDRMSEIVNLLNMNKLNQKIIILFVMFCAIQLTTWFVYRIYVDVDNQYALSKQLTISFGLGTGVTFTLFVCYLWLISACSSEKLSVYSAPIITGFIFSILSLPFGLVVGIIGGGAFGGGWMAVLFEWLNLSEKVGVSIGIGLGVFAGTTIVALPATMLGFVLGKKISGR